MTRFPPNWLQQGTYAASVDRRLIGALWPTAATTGGLVTVASGMTVNIAPGQVAVPTANNTGSALCSWDAQEQVTLAAAPASGSNRWDLIVCQLRGNDVDGGANNDFLFQGITGTAAASPAVPATPANAVLLARVYVPGASASVTAGNITDTRPYPLNSRGRVAYAENVTGYGNTVADTVLGSPQVTFTVPANRFVKLEAIFSRMNGGVNNVGFLHMREGTTIAGPEITNIQIAFSSTGAGTGGTLGRLIIPTAGAHTYCLSLEAPGGANMAASVTQPITFGAYDLGGM